MGTRRNKSDTVIRIILATKFRHKPVDFLRQRWLIFDKEKVNFLSNEITCSMFPLIVPIPSTYVVPEYVVRESLLQEDMGEHWDTANSIAVLPSQIYDKTITEKWFRKMVHQNGSLTLTLTPIPSPNPWPKL